MDSAIMPVPQFVGDGKITFETKRSRNPAKASFWSR